MGLEAGDFIDDLVETNPTGLDVKSQGDDHLRLIKHVLKATFPNFTGAMTASDAQLAFFAGPFTALNYIRALNATTLEQRTPAQVRNDIGADNASNIVTGTLPDAQLSANVALENVTNIFTVPQQIGDAASVTNLSLRIFGVRPRIMLDENDAAADEKRWHLDVASKILTIETLDDAGTGTRVAFQVNRGVGNAITQIALGNATDGPNVVIPGSGQLLKGAGSLAAPEYSWNGDTNMGFNRFATDAIAIVSNGEIRASIENGAIFKIFGRAAADQIRLGFMTPGVAGTERGYLGFPTASSDAMILRNSVGTTLQLRSADNGACLEIGDGYAALPQAVRITNVISPPALAVATHNYNPAGLATCAVIRLLATGAQQLTGIVAQPAGTRITLINIDSADTITIVNESASSTAANRFLTNGGLNISLGDGDCIDIWYDAASSRWRVFGT